VKHHDYAHRDTDGILCGMQNEKKLFMIFLSRASQLDLRAQKHGKPQNKNFRTFELVVLSELCVLKRSRTSHFKNEEGNRIRNRIDHRIDR
jgi:hypothetical protein